MFPVEASVSERSCYKKDFSRAMKAKLTKRQRAFETALQNGKKRAKLRISVLFASV